MKCPFCQNNLKKMHKDHLCYNEKLHNSSAYLQEDTCNCGGCSSYFSISISGDIISYGIHVRFNDKGIYSAIFYGNKTFALKKQEDEGGFIAPAIFSLDYYPDITPQNFLRRLPNLLLFS
jgi:hypothetical protein